MQEVFLFRQRKELHVVYRLSISIFISHVLNDILLFNICAICGMCLGMIAGKTTGQAWPRKKREENKNEKRTAFAAALHPQPGLVDQLWWRPLCRND